MKKFFLMVLIIWAGVNPARTYGQVPVIHNISQLDTVAANDSIWFAVLQDSVLSRKTKRMSMVALRTYIGAGGGSGQNIANTNLILTGNRNLSFHNYILTFDSLLAFSIQDRIGPIFTVDTEAAMVRHLAGLTSSPPGIATGVGAGSPSSASIAGDDMGGYITVNTGGSPTPGAHAIVVTVTFTFKYMFAPKCIILVPANELADDMQGTGKVWVDQAAITTTGFAINSSALALAGGKTYMWYFFVKQ